jgi:hypothetical protein
MTGKRGKTYRCAIPPVRLEGEQRRAHATKTVIEHVQPTLSKACLYRVDGWWSFEICPFKSIRQFHQDGKAITADYTLGRYNAARSVTSGAAAFEFSGTDAATGRPYFSTFFDGGTVCDLTGAPRVAELRLACSADGSNTIGQVSEPSTCAYTITLESPVLCSYPGFEQPGVIENIISCWPAPLPPPPASQLHQQQQQANEHQRAATEQHLEKQEAPKPEL